MTASAPAVRRVRGLVRSALSGVAPKWSDPGAARVGDADLVAAVARHRVAEVLLPAARSLGLSAPVVEAIEQLVAVGRRAATVQVLETARLSSLLTGAGVAHLCLKGPALAVQTSGSALGRGGGDVDLLVAPESVVDAHRLLVADGWRLREANRVDPGTWAWRHVLRAFNELSYDGPGGTVDLHWRLDPSPVVLPGFDEVWQRRVEVDLAGAKVATLAPSDALAHSCLHAAKDGHRWLRSLVDVRRLVAAHGVPGDLGRAELLTLAVTRASVGLVALAPGAERQVAGVSHRTLTRALRRQEEPARTEIPFPGAESARLMGHLVRAGAREGLPHAVLATVFPVQTVVGVDAATAWTGMPRVLAGRVRRAGRRTAAWSRRVPGAGVFEVTP